MRRARFSVRDILREFEGLEEFRRGEERERGV
jgi:hypothetical protein